jgi:hypothetical protein
VFSNTLLETYDLLELVHQTAVPDYSTCEKSDKTGEIKYGSDNDQGIIDAWLANDTNSSM